MTDGGFTPLMWASVAGHLAVVGELCVRGANVNAATTDDGFTSLMGASQKGHPKIARELLKRKANKALTSHNGSTAHSLAILPSIRNLL